MSQLMANIVLVVCRLEFKIACPCIFQRMMSVVPADAGAKSLFCYMDGLISCFNAWDEQLALFGDTFSSCQRAGLTLKPSTIQFGKK